MWNKVEEVKNELLQEQLVILVGSNEVQRASAYHSLTKGIKREEKAIISVACADREVPLYEPAPIYLYGGAMTVSEYICWVKTFGYVCTAILNPSVEAYRVFKQQWTGRPASGLVLMDTQTYREVGRTNEDRGTIVVELDRSGEFGFVHAM
ncbi:hypothetical protein COC63_06365 [Bacillus cereus]|nr:hypothetical protein COC63_06365 [Bacillus cereus]